MMVARPDGVATKYMLDKSDSKHHHALTAH